MSLTEKENKFDKNNIWQVVEQFDDGTLQIDNPTLTQDDLIETDFGDIEFVPKKIALDLLEKAVARCEQQAKSDERKRTLKEIRELWKGSEEASEFANRLFSLLEREGLD